jgi:hypothetical protein
MTTKNNEEAIVVFNECTKNMVGKSYIHKLNNSGFLCKQIHMYYTSENDYIICVSEFNINPNLDYLSGTMDKTIPIFGIVPLHKFQEYYTPFVSP